MTEHPGRQVWIILTYMALVLLVDTLTVQSVLQSDNLLLDLPILSAINWQHFYWQWQSFDLFKLLFWLLIPLCYVLRRGWRHIDWRWLSLRTATQSDWLILIILSLGGLAAILVIPHISGLSTTYLSPLAQMDDSARAERAVASLIWVLCWLPGWEFMHRYILLRAVKTRWPVLGWLCVPLLESVYHLQKYWLEALGMLVLSIILTRWTLARGSMAMPALLHGVIELELILFLYMY